MEVLFYIVIALVVGFALGRSQRRPERSFQNDGESRLSRTIRACFNAPNYHLLNHITLRMNDGTTQVDHILVSRFGVFVIETKDYNGWIFANFRTFGTSGPCEKCWTSFLLTASGRSWFSRGKPSSRLKSLLGS